MLLGGGIRLFEDGTAVALRQIRAIPSDGVIPFTLRSRQVAAVFADKQHVATDAEQSERRVERAVFETDRQLVVGDVTLPAAGYHSRFSDTLNRPGAAFLSLTNVEITSLADGKVTERPFVALAKDHIRYAYPLGD